MNEKIEKIYNILNIKSKVPSLMFTFSNWTKMYHFKKIIYIVIFIITLLNRQEILYVIFLKD